jgi:SAM-dependent methyltransferase
MHADHKAHWEGVYTSKGEAEVSWFENRPELSLRLLSEAGLRPEWSVVDIGGGASRLVDCLVEAGQAHVTTLDLSATALEKARARLAGRGDVDWVASDVTQWQPGRVYDAWHDRAAFHFLTEPSDQARYAAVLRSALRSGGIAIIGTFAPDGPEKCSGLPVARHDANSLQQVLGPQFQLLSSVRHSHLTPWGSTQHFHFGTFRYSATE